MSYSVKRIALYTVAAIAILVAVGWLTYTVVYSMAP